MRKLAARGTACCLVTVAALSCAAKPEPTSYAVKLRDSMDTAAVFAHLQHFQEIADLHAGNRRSGTGGYDASVDYVAGVLRAVGFAVSTPAFVAELFTVAAESLDVDGESIAVRAVEHSGASPAGGVRGELLIAPVDATPGCDREDYAGLPVGGAVVVVRRGGCYLSDKVAVATASGAVAMVIANDSDEKVFSAGLLASDAVRIPVLSVDKNVGEDLAQRQGTAHVVVDASVERRMVRNVIAQTNTGSTTDVVVAGAHLDSVRLGPGVNDNASGVAALLETARQMGPDPQVANAVRFAFWGGEEEWLLGSQHYVSALDDKALSDIALYLNFDMVGSPNPGYLVLDTDGSSEPDPEADVGVPAGSAPIERAFRDYLAGQGVQAQDLVFDGRGDWNPFAQSGIPVGALCTGNEALKTAEQAQVWGGRAGQAFDPNYHSADDTIGNISRAALDVTVPTIAYAVGLYAEPQSDAYKVPPRHERTRTKLTR